MATAKNPHQNSGREKWSQAYHTAGEAMTETKEHLKERARSSVDSNKQRASDVAHKAEDSIKQHPLVSVGCAFAAGWVIAKLFK